MKKIKMQVNFKKYNILLTDNSYYAFCHMDCLKTLKKRVRYAILNNEYDKMYLDKSYVCHYVFISSVLRDEKGIACEHLLKRIDEVNFKVEESV